MALTLIESSAIALGRDETVIVGTVMEIYARSSMLLSVIPFEDMQGNAYKFNRESSLPSTAFRGVNEAYAESTGKVDPVTESLAIAGGDIDIDNFLLKTGGPGQRETQESMKIKSLALNMTKYIVKGDSSTEIKAIDGLQVRATGNQLIAAGSTANGTPLSLAKLDELIDAVDNPTHLVMNKTLIRKLTAAARTTAVGGFITWEKDEFGRRIAFYNDLPLIAVEEDSTSTAILGFTEAASSGTSTGTSIYCVRFAEDGVKGLQNADMEIRDLGELQTKPVVRSRVEWFITLAQMQEKALARLWTISNAAVTL